MEKFTGQIKQFFDSIVIDTLPYSMIEITDNAQKILNKLNSRNGLLTLMSAHTSASLTIQENADPSVQTDMIKALSKIAPEQEHYSHSLEGPDDMPAHIKTTLTSVSLSISVKSGNMLLGTWQGIYLMEHRNKGRRRTINCHYIGDVN